MANTPAEKAGIKPGDIIIGYKGKPVKDDTSLVKEVAATEIGKEADLLLIPGNPLEEIRYLQDALMVISNGQIALKRIPFGKE